MKADGSFLIYGANGYTGALMAAEAVRRGLRPVLAGRREAAVREVAGDLGLAHRAFALDDPDALARELEPFAAVLLAAGPFSATSAPVLQACLPARTHYLDVTGEIAVLDACYARDEEARARGVVVLPAVGFDVVPSDCLAAALKARLPDAHRLDIAVHAIGRASRGTLKSMIEGLPRGGAVREDGRLRPVPTAWRARDIEFPGGARHAVTVPWADLSSAYRSTGIPNIVAWLAMPRRQARALRLARPFESILGAAPAQRLLKRAVERTVTGPDAETRRAARSELWARVEDLHGRRSVEGTLVAPEAYSLTAAVAVECARRVAAGEVEPGAHAPSQAFGAEFITAFKGCELRLGHE